MVLYQSPEKHLENMQKDTPQPLWGSKSFFSRESDSRIANVRLSVCLLQKPLSLSELLLLTNVPVDHQAINHRAIDH